MDAVTYPEDKVVAFFEAEMIPLRVAFDQKPLSQVFNVKWTPTLVILDQEGKEHHRTVGFLSADELLASLLLGIAKTHFDADRFEEALKYLGRVLEDFPQTASAPEAIFLRGVSQYKSTNDPKPLKAAYEELEAKFPGNEWTKRAYPYRLI